MPKRSVVTMLAICAIGVLVGSTGAGDAGKPVPVARALEILEPIEKRVERAQWKVKVVAGKLLDVNDLSRIVLDIPYAQGSVVFEPTSGRYVAKVESVRKWLQGGAAYNAVREFHAFDGTISRRFHQEKPGTEFGGPKDFPGHGTISKGLKNRATQIMGGANYFPPYFYGQKLSDLIREAQDKGSAVEIKENENGIWHLKTADPSVADGVMELVFDPGKGLVLERTLSNGRPKQPWNKVTVNAQKVSGEFWVPETVTMVAILDKNAWQHTFSEVPHPNGEITRLISVLESDSGKQLRRWSTPDKTLRCVLHFPGGDVVQDAVVTESLADLTSGQVRWWDTRSGRLIRQRAFSWGWVEDIAFSPDGRTLALAGKDGTVRLWDTFTAAERRAFSWPRCAACNRNNHFPARDVQEPSGALGAEA